MTVDEIKSLFDEPVKASDGAVVCSRWGSFDREMVETLLNEIDRLELVIVTQNVRIASMRLTADINDAFRESVHGLYR